MSINTTGIETGTRTIEVQVTVVAFIEVPDNEATADLSGWDFSDDVDYLVSEAVQDLVDEEITIPVTIWDESGENQTEDEVTGTITGLSY